MRSRGRCKASERYKTEICGSKERKIWTDFDRFGTFGLVLILIWYQMASTISTAERKQKRAALWMVAPNQRTSRLTVLGRAEKTISLCISKSALIERNPANSKFNCQDRTLFRCRFHLLSLDDTSLKGDSKSEISNTIPVQHRTTLLNQFFTRAGISF